MGFGDRGVEFLSIRKIGVFPNRIWHTLPVDSPPFPGLGLRLGPSTLTFFAVAATAAAPLERADLPAATADGPTASAAAAPDAIPIIANWAAKVASAVSRQWRENSSSRFERN